MTHPWRPSLGAWPEAGGVAFRVWAPEVRTLELVLEGPGPTRSLPMTRQADGSFRLRVDGVGSGARYRYRADGHGPFPDPASRFQPEGVHGPSEVIDAGSYEWRHGEWAVPAVDELVLYELHVGTFAPEGTFAGVERRLRELKELGVNAVELMPVGDFPGSRNWGYDGVSIFAPARCYGRPDDLRRLVEAAHELGLAVFLDVVYNHLGPDGNYTGVYSPHYLSKKHRTPWGDALNFDGPQAEHVREFFIENALHWVHEYRIDGLRLDATHAIHDDSRKHFLAELVERVQAGAAGRTVRLIAEDHRNLAHMVRPAAEGGWGYDGLWADDFHHEVRRLLAGDDEGYYADYTGTAEDLARTVELGWFYCGQPAMRSKKPRGSDPAGLPRHAFVVCVQNHDQVGNRAFGERLHHQIEPSAYRAASALFLCCPATPLLFMGQEWACSTPFRFFTEHTPELGRLVTEGRRREFRHFSAFTDPAARERIPDPQAPATFEACRLKWDERDRPPHRGVWELYRRLLALRRERPDLFGARGGRIEARAAGEGAVVLRREAGGGEALIVCRLRGEGKIPVAPPGRGRWDVLLHTEEAAFCEDGRPPRIDPEGGIDLARPGAVILVGK